MESPGGRRITTGTFSNSEQDCKSKILTSYIICCTSCGTETYNIHTFKLTSALKAEIIRLPNVGFRISTCQDMTQIRFFVLPQWVGACVVFKHPRVDAFLREMAKRYELVIWIVGLQPYAEPIVNWLDPYKVVFSRRICRIKCTQFPGGRCIKDLTRLGVDL